MSLVAVADAGTTNLKAGVVDPEGELVSLERRPIPLQQPEEGAAEHDAEELYRAFVEVVREATADCADRVEALALSGYQFGFAPLDEDDRPLTGFITLMDTRSRAAAERIADEIGREGIYRRTGCPPLFTSLLAKVTWMRSEKPELLRRTRRFADVKAYLIRRLTGRFATEPSIAASTQLLNCRSREWDETLLDAAGVDAEQLPTVAEGSRVLAELDASAADELGLEEGVKLVPGVYDGGAILPGTGGLTEETGVCNLGTSAMLRACVDRPALDDPAQARIQAYPLLPGKWTVGGGVNNAGSALQWLRDNLGGGRDYDELLAEASDVPAGSDGVVCLPYLTGERDPRIGAQASGLFSGLCQQHGTGHLTRSLLEGVAFTLDMLKDALEDNDINPQRLMVAGSGSRSDLWPQILADVMDAPVQKSVTEEVSLIGEAMLGHACLGSYASLEEACEGMVRLGTIFEPDAENVRAYREKRESFDAVLDGARSLYS
ncbi:MAG: gluconokinase [Planctomycetota bacterium]